MQSEILAHNAPVRWGVFSAANIAVKHVIPAILSSQSEMLLALASRNPQRARELMTHLPSVRIYGDYESLLEDPEIEAIYNPLPNSLHAEWTIRALQAKKHVLCEKPLAVTAEQGAAMIEAARANGVLLMEAFMYRFHPQTIWALEQVHSGRIGTVKLVRASFCFNILLPPRLQDIRLQAALAGGSLMDVGCYPINFCRAVYGHPPVAVAARVYVPEDAEVERSANAVLDFGNGGFGLIDSSFELPSRQVVEIIGDTGTITIPVPFTPGNAETEVILALEGQTIHQRVSAVDQYRLEVEHFGACVRSGTTPSFSLEETIENLATIEAIYSSAGYHWPPAHTRA
ncbi:MAG TPA: Gfo/Idh/MocA family oxidoreductase [Ktedonobacteraceae bacterium]|nr:Gfo/Idh/MocA family oxidoreductase [Ktedonobacteraceae bacterium]